MSNDQEKHLEPLPPNDLPKWVSLYENNSVLQGLIRFVYGVGSSIPILGAIPDALASVLTTRFEQILNERRRVFFEELAKGEHLLTPEIVDSDEFIQAFLATYSAANRTQQHEKIRMFAHLLGHGIEESKLISDDFEEFLKILGDLTLREIEILYIIKHFEDNYPRQYVEKNGNMELENDMSLVMKYWELFEREVESKLGLDRSYLQAMLIRIRRTGLYRTFDGQFLGYTGREGRLTPMFYDFIKWIEDKDTHTS